MHPKNLTWIKNFLTWDFHLNSIDDPIFHGFEGQEPGIIRFYLPIDIHNTVHSSPCPQFSFKFIPIKIPIFCSLVRSFHKSTSIQQYVPHFLLLWSIFSNPSWLPQHRSTPLAPRGYAVHRADASGQLLSVDAFVCFRVECDAWHRMD